MKAGKVQMMQVCPADVTRPVHSIVKAVVLKKTKFSYVMAYVGEPKLPVQMYCVN